MPHVVTQACCADASCVYACPVNCIHPTPDEPDFATAEMVYIDPASCVDCGACVSACPVGAIVPGDRVPEDQLPFVAMNELFYAAGRIYPVQAPIPATVEIESDQRALRVAVVGAGPAALYAADELLKQPGVEVTVFDRLPTPHGLVRAGVAPDHVHTKEVVDLFAKIENQDGFAYSLNVEVGRDISHEELRQHHHAVIYATGASKDRSLGIPGEELRGSITATDFVAWYNGHPDQAERTFDLSGPRVVIIGNGNVALDVARILTTDPDELAETDISPLALAALRDSRIEEAMILGRRGVAQAAYTLPELTGLIGRSGVDLVADRTDLVLDPITAAARKAGDLDVGLEQKIALMEEVAGHGGNRNRRRIVFGFLVAPLEFIGTDSVTSVRVVRTELRVDEVGVVRAVPTDRVEVIDASLVLRSIGYRGVAVLGVEFDQAAGVIPNVAGRVSTGTYAVGWIKRGSNGFIGTNKSCSRETVSNLLRDFNDGKLAEPAGSRAAFADLLASRSCEIVDLRGWRSISAVERARGRSHGAVREKLTSRSELLAAARSKPPRSRILARLSR